MLSVTLTANHGISKREKGEAVLPFRLINGMIGVTVTVNDVKGLYLLDSGASDLIINGTPNNHDESFTTVYGDVSAEKVAATLSVGPINNQKLDAWRIDLSRFEQRLGMKIDGLIGGTTMEQYDIMIDYMMQNIVFLDFTQYGLEVSPSRRVVVLPFTTHFQNLPIVEAQVNDKTVLLGFDTGANANAFSAEFRQICDEKEEKIEFEGMKINVSLDETGYMDKLEMNENEKIHGILSASSLRADQIVISYSRSKIYLLYDQLYSSN